MSARTDGCAAATPFLDHFVGRSLVDKEAATRLRGYFLSVT